MSRSIKQGCPLAPLLYAIASDGLTWLVHDKLDKGKIKGIRIDEKDKYAWNFLLMIQMH